MDRIQDINPGRIQWCCDSRGVSTKELSEAVGIAEATLAEVMDGEVGLTFNQLRKVADYFNRGVLFFIEPGPVTEEQVYSPQFRTLTNQKPELSPKVRALVERVERQREIYLSLREDAGERTKLSFVPPKVSRGGISAVADATRKWLALEDRNDFVSYRNAVQRKQILVFQTNGYNGPWQIAKDDPIAGFSLYHLTCPVIVVKKLPFDSRQVFTLFHELGHLLLHKRSSIDDENDLYSYQGDEREANAFAGLVLVPDTFLIQIDDGDRPEKVSEFDAWLKPQGKAWGVSPEVILRRLLDSHRLDQAKYDAYRTWRKKQGTPQSTGGTRQYRYREPMHVFGEPFVNAVFEALHNRAISLAKASTYLDNLKIKDLHRLEG